MKNIIMKTKGKMAAMVMAALLGVMCPTNAQNLGISATGVAPNPSAGLDVNFTDRGVLIPRIALTSTTSAGPISNPANSLLVYNTTNNPSAGLTPGYYYNAGTTTSPIWVRLLNGGSPSDAWLTRGNAGTNPATHFIGTTDNVDLVFRTNNTEKMRITASGSVGIGTTAPISVLNIRGFSGGTGGDPLAGYTRNLVIGGLYNQPYNSGNVTLLEIRDYDNDGGNVYPIYVCDENSNVDFFLKAGTTGSNSNAIAYFGGRVGIGTTTPNERLSVVGNICATGNITGNSATCGSDIRWKKDLKPLENTLEKISQLKPVYYYWKKDEFPDKHFTDKRQIGLIAQDMQKVFPELVVEDKEGYLSVDYSRFTSVLLKAIQEQQQIIQDQQKIIQELQAENAQTKSELKALAEKMNILINTLSAEKKVGNK